MGYICTYNQLNQWQQVKSGSIVKHKFTYLVDDCKLESQWHVNRSTSTFPLSSYLPQTDETTLFDTIVKLYDGNIEYSDGSARINNPYGYTLLNNTEKSTFYNVLNYRGDVAGVYQVVGNKLQCVQNLRYYPSGVLWATSSGQGVQPYKYGEKELMEISGLDMYDNLARYYAPAIGRANSMDPLCEKYYSISPYAWCGNNFMNIIDPNGMDTIDVGYNEETETWEIQGTQIVEGDDVVNVTDADGNTSTYTFSEGEYGERVIALNIEDNGIQTFGIIHISGAEDGTFEYVVPAGDGSSVPNSNKRIPDGEYPIIAPHIDAKWQQPGLGGNVSGRGVRFHYGTDISWSAACYLLFTEYNKDTSGKIHFSLKNSMQTIRNFNYKLGAHSILYTYSIIENNKEKFRQGATYLKPINYIFIQKTLK